LQAYAGNVLMIVPGQPLSSPVNSGTDAMGKSPRVIFKYKLIA
jgi:hypothetical protein